MRRCVIDNLSPLFSSLVCDWLRRRWTCSSTYRSRRIGKGNQRCDWSIESKLDCGWSIKSKVDCDWSIESEPDCDWAIKSKVYCDWSIKTKVECDLSINIKGWLWLFTFIKGCRDWLFNQGMTVIGQLNWKVLGLKNT